MLTIIVLIYIWMLWIVCTVWCAVGRRTYWWTLCTGTPKASGRSGEQTVILQLYPIGTGPRMPCASTTVLIETSVRPMSVSRSGASCSCWRITIYRANGAHRDLKTDRAITVAMKGTMRESRWDEKKRCVTSFATHRIPQCVRSPVKIFTILICWCWCCRRRFVSTIFVRN